MSWHLDRRIAAALALVLIASNAAFAEPSPNPACPALDQGGTSFNSVKEIPAPIATELARKMPGAILNEFIMADRDQPWQVTDVVIPGPRLPSRRFIRGGNVGSRWYIWYETGGIAHEFYVAIVELPSTREAAKAVTHFFASPDRMCSETREHLADPTPASEPEHDIW
ncbi:MAG TPA: hypothetical protein VKS60_24925 [Stellaceae bacterium]|nr:hypothetical protein [Stellaceae bacterium]